MELKAAKTNRKREKKILFTVGKRNEARTRKKEIGPLKSTLEVQQKLGLKFLRFGGKKKISAFQLFCRPLKDLAGPSSLPVGVGLLRGEPGDEVVGHHVFQSIALSGSRIKKERRGSFG